jgi:hypothetical protein
MEFTLTTPAILFSAISLLLLAYTNRYLALAALVRNLHRQYKAEQDPIIANQIVSLRKRIELIKNMQLLGVISFFLCTLCMFLIFMNEMLIGQIVFGVALIMLMASLVLSAMEVQKSSDALRMRLSDMESLKDSSDSTQS